MCFDFTNLPISVWLLLRIINNEVQHVTSETNSSWIQEAQSRKSKGHLDPVTEYYISWADRTVRLVALFLLLLGRISSPRTSTQHCHVSRVVDLGDCLVEGLTLGLGDLQLKGRGLARAVGRLFTEGGQSEKCCVRDGQKVIQQRSRHPRHYRRGPHRGWTAAGRRSCSPEGRRRSRGG